MKKSLWSALETVPGLTATISEWRRVAGDGFESLKPFLRPNGETAHSVPCPAVRNCGCNHQIAEHAADDIVAACRCEPRRCRSIKIDKVDVALHEVDFEKLGAAISKALSAEPDDRVFDGLHMTRQIGTYSPRPGFQVQVFMTAQSERNEFVRVVDHLSARIEKPFIIFSPTASLHGRSNQDLNQKNKFALLALDEVLSSNGRLSVERPLNEILADFLERVTPPEKELFVFKKEGDTWRLIFQGKETTTADSRGMTHIAVLVSVPNQEIHCTQLFGSIEPVSLRSEENRTDRSDETPNKCRERVSVDSLLDKEAINQYKNRLDDLDEKIRDAEGMGDNETASRHKEELHAISKEISRTVYRGKPKRSEGPVKKARQAVSKAIKAAVKAIKKSNPALGEHFARAIKPGEYLAYRPEQDIRWNVYLSSDRG